MPDGKLSTKERFATACRRFYDWKTEHQFLGRYSVDKLQQFDRYQRTAGLARCCAVITLLSVLPVFLLLVGLHSIPVASPDLGIKHNVAATVRSAIGHAILSTTWVFYMMHSLGSLKECHPLKVVVLSVVAGGILPEGLWVGVSLLWRYPVPGSGLVKTFISLGCIILIARYSQTKESWAMNRQRTRILTIVMAEYLLIVVLFMLLAFAFSKAPWGVQLSLMVIQLPLRSLLKRQSWVYARKLNDLSTDVTLNIVDISASLYQALCILYARNVELAALIVMGELILGLATAHMYSTHTFIVDGYRTMQTAIKIVEGSLPSTVVVEEDETQKEELAQLNEIHPHQERAVEAVTSAKIEAIENAKYAQRLCRAASDTATINSRRLTHPLGASVSGTAAISSKMQQSSKCFPIAIQKLHRVLSDPATGKTQLQHWDSAVFRRTITSVEGPRDIKLPPKSGRTPREAEPPKVAKDNSNSNPHRLHRRMTTAAGVVSARNEPPLSSKNVQFLRRTASDTIPEQKEKPSRKSTYQDFGDATHSRRSEPHLQSWARDPSKVYCFAEIRQEYAPSPKSPKMKRFSLGRRSSLDLPPLADLHSPDGFGHRPPLRRSTSVFLTPRTLLKHGSKRLLDLGRSTGRGTGNAHSGTGEMSPKAIGSPNDARKPTQVNIDGMLVVRKDQARILEQTLQLLFSCEVLVVAEFVKVIVPFVLGLLLVTLSHLPSAHYNILLRGLSKQRIVEKMVWCLCFAALEVPALAMICVVVFKKYGISPLHLLAFLLEQQYANFQTKLTSCFLALFFSTSVHQGMEWISSQ